MIVNLVVQMLGKQLERMRVGYRAPAQAKMMWLITRKVLDQLHESVGLRLRLATIGKLAYVPIDYFSSFHRVAFLKLFCLLSLGIKCCGLQHLGMMLGWDPSKGQKLSRRRKTAPVGSSMGGGAAQGKKGAGPGKALIVGPLPKLTGPRKLSMKRAPV